MKNVLIIVNPVSGIRRGRIVAKRVRTELEKHEIKVRIEETKHKNHAYEIASTVCTDEIDEIVSIGGDGTINEIANALIDTGNLNCRIAVIPTGVGNFIARNLGVTKNCKKAAKIALNENTREIDVF
ncbi:MAG: acylglycerol kinase family protein, partial [Planctomycetes bacterium]|nr:acylglycerol kinase family protein [Planctomycetota bacterium]